MVVAERAPHVLLYFPVGRGVAQPGSAPGLGPGGRRFESCLPDHRSRVATYGKRASGRSALCGTSSLAEADVVTLQRTRLKKDRAMAAGGYTINPTCMSCGVCEDVCPRSAIVEARRQFVIRRSTCDACGICAGFCPVRAIVRRT